MSESVKENKVDANTLFIGIGGIGSRIVKGVAELCGEHETDNVNFVCLDTNVNDLSAIRGSKARMRYVQISTTETVGNYLNYDDDARQNWFPKNTVMYDKTVSEGAGQVRAISRLALNDTIKTGRIQPLYDAIDELFLKDGRELRQVLRIVFASSASGGTGSGIYLPLSMLIRDYVNTEHPNTGVVIRSLLLLPGTLDSVIKSSVEKESQRRNAYALIKEMNAFMMQGGGYTGIKGGELERYKDTLYLDFPVPGTERHKRLAVLPADFVFLMDGQDAEDCSMTSMNQYIRQASLSLYEQNIGPMQKNAFSVEDNIIKEMSNPGMLGRNRFGGIGSSVIRYPYEQVTEYVGRCWAQNNIGGTNETARWTKVDKLYRADKARDEKAGLSELEIPTLGQYYVEQVSENLSEKDPFYKVLYGRYLSDAEDRVDVFKDALEEELRLAVNEQSEIKRKLAPVKTFATKDYAEQRNVAKDDLDKMRRLKQLLEDLAAQTGRRRADGFLWADTPASKVSPEQTYTVEALIRDNDNKFMHPCAMRYMLYVAQERIAEEKERIHTENADVAKKLKRDLQEGGRNEDGSENLASRAARDDGRAVATEEESKGVKIFRKKTPDGMTASFFDELNNDMAACVTRLRKYGENLAIEAGLIEAYDYITRFLDAMKDFYDSFSGKVEDLEQQKTDIAESLRFNKGDSVLNVCCTREELDELVLATKAKSNESGMLSSELNEGIYNALKANISFQRDNEGIEVIEEDNRKDVFDDILLKYFVNQVKLECKSIDMNIVEAIAYEYRLDERIKARQEQKRLIEEGALDKDKAQLIDHVDPRKSVQHIQRVIARGSRLAAPGITRMTNVEPREINLCSYNVGLDAMTTYDMDTLVPRGNSAVRTETISRRELHFFNAVYNIRADKINRFSSSRKTETGYHKGGTYFDAYMTYKAQVGPDSTKDTVISTHIDKRWDSLAVMPAIDFDFQAREMRSIHCALIYGLVYKAIVYEQYSHVEGATKAYRYIDSTEHIRDLVVSNGTVCDEFFEILDAMYSSNQIVEDVYTIRATKNKEDEQHHTNYTESAFCKSLQEFEISNVHEGRTSLFEIPIVYYNSLPNAKRYRSELSSMVDAVISVFDREMHKWEKQEDVPYLMFREIMDQVNLMLDNYEAIPSLSDGIKTQDNPVMDIIYRKVKGLLGDEKTPKPVDYQTRLEALHDRIYGANH